MNAYEAKQEEKRQRLLARAEQVKSEANSLYSNASALAQIIPFGQPILVGHHSEKSDRSFRNNMEMLAQDNYKVISASPDLEFSKVYIREFLQGEPDRYEVLEVCGLEYEKGFGFTIIRDNGQRFSGSALNHLCLQVLRKVAITFGITLFSFSAGGRHE